ncbi:hypothetical protein O181_066397 [Austropuccinia psidii MF-1]|uniref:Uncharacterized protein n=1 Tax=Austropuccinia psidii MF-1 TaxID=1389203 RepID=A0A9Q3EZ21_9BASI|nr:hypothetical protein [Austropuccinia psidii MF-1]
MFSNLKNYHFNRIDSDSRQQIDNDVNDDGTDIGIDIDNDIGKDINKDIGNNIKSDIQDDIENDINHCQSCQTPLSMYLAREPLFDHSNRSAPPSPTLSQKLSSSSPKSTASYQSPLRSLSPNLSPTNTPLDIWWSDLPAHRRNLIIESDSWPILTENNLINSPLFESKDSSNLNSTNFTNSCNTCHSLNSNSTNSQSTSNHQNFITSSPTQSHTSQSPRSIRPSRPSRSSSTNLNLLIPTPLDHDELDPLLSSPSLEDPFTSSSNHSISNQPLQTIQNQNHIAHTPILDQNAFKPSVRRKKKKDEQESLLTKSLRRLSRKLPNIQWGNLNVIRLGSNPNHEIIKEQEQEDDLLPSGVVDLVDQDQIEPNEVVENSKEDEKNQITRLVKSWTFDTIQPQNRLNGTFINDPEMEWSSMMVQLESFSPNLEKNQKRKNKTKIKNNEENPKKQVEPDDEKPDQNKIKSIERKKNHDGISNITEGSRRRRKNNNHAQNNTIKKNKKMVVIKKRLVSNPLHLLQLTLELEMMRNQKIKSPLKQRAIKLIVIRDRLSSITQKDQSKLNFHHSLIGPSPLRFEL